MLFNKLKNILSPAKKSALNKALDPLDHSDKQDERIICDGPTVIGQDEKQTRVQKLTPREHDLYLLLLEGYTLKESAMQLSIKYSTANTHMSGVYKKLGVNSRAELIINYRGIRA